MSVEGCDIAVRNTFKTLGVKLNSTLTKFLHTIFTITTMRFALRYATNTKAYSIVGYRIDYCNLLLHGAGERILYNLQRAQNRLLRVFLRVTEV